MDFWQSFTSGWRASSAPILAMVVFAVGLLMPVQAFAETVDQRIARLETHYIVRHPENAVGRTPVVIMLHGCGGPRPFIEDMADAAAAAGATAIVVDSFAPRRISRMASTTCPAPRPSLASRRNTTSTVPSTTMSKASSACRRGTTRRHHATSS